MAPNGSDRQLVAATEGLLIDGVPSKRLSLGTWGGMWFTVKTGDEKRRIRGCIDVSASNRRLLIVATLSVDDYIAGTIAAESYRTDPLEYLTALARLQRNFLETHRHRHDPVADLCDNTHCQRTDIGRATARQRLAAERSASIVRASRPCYYSVNCGGRTLTPLDVWGRREIGYVSVKCDYCRNSPWRRWGRTIPSSPEIDRLLSRHAPTPFVDENLKIALGRLAGYALVPGNTFDQIERRGGAWRVYGRGFGHRVGLCQEGARRLARQGRSAREILQFYFPARMGE